MRQRQGAAAVRTPRDCAPHPPPAMAASLTLASTARVARACPAAAPMRAAAAPRAAPARGRAPKPRATPAPAGRRSIAAAAASNGGLAIDLRGGRRRGEAMRAARGAARPAAGGRPRPRERARAPPAPRAHAPPSQPLPNLSGKKAFIAGVADDQGFGWAIAKALAEAGAEISLGVWVPALNIFESSLRRGKFDANRTLSDGSLMQFEHVFPMDAVYDTPADVPADVAANKRYAAAGDKGFTVAECAANVEKAVGKIDVLVHSLANGPEVAKPLLETTRNGYLAAVSASAFSAVSMVQRFGPIMNPGGAVVSLTYLASERIIPGYGGGMSSAKAALESDTRVLAWEAGRKHRIRVNTISAGPLGSRAAKAIGFIDDMIRYSYANAPVQKELEAREVGAAAAFLLSPLASAITGSTVYVDNGLNTMGLAVDSKALAH